MPSCELYADTGSLSPAPGLANKWAGFFHSAGSYTLVYTITTNTSIVTTSTAVSSNSLACYTKTSRFTVIVYNLFMHAKMAKV